MDPKSRTSRYAMYAKYLSEQITGEGAAVGPFHICCAAKELDSTVGKRLWALSFAPMAINKIVLRSGYRSRR